MDIHIISIFPEMFSAITEQGVISRAIKQNVLSLTIHNPRDYADDKRSTVDGRPYGGGPGMVMLPDVMTKTITVAKQAAIRRTGQNDSANVNVVYLSPQGKRFTHAAATRFAKSGSLVLLAGRYEGIDERVIASQVDEEWSIGDYVLSGGELPAMVMIDAIARLLPDSLGNHESSQQDSFAQGLLDCPHYTKPEVFDGQAVPQVLRGGDHQAIQRWRLKQALGRTWLRRPELLDKADLSDQQLALLAEFKNDLLK